MPEIILPIVFCITLLLLKIVYKEFKIALSARVAMATMLFITAIAHFVFTKGMSLMLPDGLPFKISLVYFTGIIEAVAAIGLLVPRYTKLTGWLLIVFFLLLLPANIFAAIRQLNMESATFDGDGPAYLWYRIPLQLFFMAWVYFSAIQPFANQKVGYRNTGVETPA